MKNLTALLIMTTLLFACTKKRTTEGTTAPPIVIEAEATVFTSETKQTIRGFGCATVFTPPNTTALTDVEFDRLFGSANGQVGLTMLRIRLASDDVWRAIELNHAKAVIQRGGIVFASPWSPPARMKTNNSIIKGKLISDSAANYAKYLNDYATYMAANGAPIYAVSVQNEPDWEPDYESCTWTATEMTDFIKNYGNLITATKLMAPELVNNNQTYVNTILSDPGAAANLDIVGTHLYGGGIVENALAKSKGLDVWMTEHLDTAITFQAALGTAVEINDCFTKANFNAYTWWYGKRYYGLIGQDGLVTKRGYVVSHFARFVRPGAIRLATTTSSANGVMISAYKNGEKKVLLVINTSGNEVQQKITFQNANVLSMLPFLSTSLKNVEQGIAISLPGNSFTYTMPPNSIATFVEQ